MRRSVLLLFLAIGALFAQPGGPHIIFGTVQTLEHTVPECFQLTVTRDGIATVVDFDEMGNEYDPDYSDTAGLFIVTLEDVTVGEIIELYLEDLCLLEYTRHFHTAGVSTETDLGLIVLSDTPIGLRPELTDATVAPEAGYITDEYEFGVSYYSMFDFDPSVLFLVVDGEHYVHSMGFPDLDYSAAPVRFPNTFDGDMFGKGEHSYYFETWDSRPMPLPGFSDTSVFTIMNTPPESPDLVLTPEIPFYDEDITVAITNHDDDVDGDAVSYIYDWFVDGELVVGVDGAILTNDHFSRWSEVVVSVMPFDGDDYGVPSEAEVTVIAPEIIDPMVDPDAGFRDEDFTYTATYRNLDDLAPFSVQISIDGEDPVDMDPVDPFADTWETGVDYTYTHSFTTVGDHTYQILVEDVEDHTTETEVLDGPETYNNEPAAPLTVDLTSDTDPVTVLSTLTALADGATDEDDMDVITYYYYWYVNGEPVDVPMTQNIITGTYFARGDSVWVEASAWDGWEESDVVVSGKLYIDNAVPEAPIATYEPMPPFEMEDIEVTITEEGTDADDDDIIYVYHWYLGGELTFEGSTLPAEETTWGQEWECRIMTWDGLDFSDPFVLNIEIEYPTFADGWYEPDTGVFTSGDEFTFYGSFSSIKDYEVETAWVLLDTGDTIWMELYIEPEPADSDSTGDLLEITDEVWAGTGPVVGRGAHTFTLGGYDTEGNFIVDIEGPYTGPTIDNTAPVLTEAWVGSDPDDEFSRDGDLVAIIEATDDDLDELTAEYIWYLDGEELVGHTGAALESPVFARGHEVYFDVRVTDGIDTTEWMSSDPITVGNAVPHVTEFFIENEAPLTTDELTTYLETLDRDEDELSFTYAWLRDGEFVAHDGDVLPPSYTKKHEMWQAIVEATDGIDVTVDTTEAIEIQNTPPHMYAEFEYTYAIYGVTYHALFPARDNDFDMLTYDLDGPEGMEIGMHNGRIEWMPDTIGIFAVDVTVADDEVEMEYGFELEVLPDTTDMLIPRNLVAESGFAGAIPLSWDEPVIFDEATVLPLGFTGYEIERKRPGAGEWTVVELTSALSWIDTDVMPDQSYVYRVRAVFTGLTSGWSGESFATSGAAGSELWYSPFTYLGAPVLDGEMSVGEWYDAMSFAIEDVYVYIKNTGNMLYIAAVDMRDMTLEEDDRLMVTIDDDYNRRFPGGAGSDEGEYRLQMGDEDFLTTFQGIYGTYPAHISRDPRFTSDKVAGAISDESGYVVYEMAIHLDSTEPDLDDINAAMGSLIGVRIEIFDAGEVDYDLTWPAGSDLEDAAAFGSIYLGIGENIGNIYVVPQVEEIFLRSGTEGSLPLFVGNNGRGTITYNLAENYHPWVFDEDELHEALEADILVLENDEMLASQALELLGYTSDLYTDSYEFLAALVDPEMAWKLVVVATDDVPEIVFDALDAYHLDGGKTILATANLDALDAEHTIWDNWGVSVYENLAGRSSALNFDEADHAIFNIPFLVPPTFDRLGGEYADYGDALQAMPGEETALLPASFDRIPYPVNGAIAIAPDMKSIINSFAVGGLDNEDEEGVTDGVRLLANEIFYLGRRSDIPWLTVSPESGFLVSREEDEAEVHFNTLDMPEGTYTGYVHVTSNDPETPLIIVECIMHIGGRVPLEMMFTEAMTDIAPGEDFSVFVRINDLFGLNVDNINFTVNSPAPWLSPYGYEIFEGEGRLMDISSGSVTIAVEHEDYFEGGLFARIDYHVDLEAPVGAETDISLFDVTYNEDSYLTDTPEIGEPFHVSVVSNEEDWRVGLTFTSHGREDVLNFGVAPGASDGYDLDLDEPNDPTGTWFDVKFDITEFDSVVEYLDTDLRANGEEIVWIVETGDSAGKVEWTFRDEDTLRAMGSLFLNGEIDMKEISDYDYAAGEDLVIAYRTRGDTPYTYTMNRGYNMFSLPVDAGTPLIVDEVFPENYGCWMFNADPDVRNWASFDTLIPGIGYIILIPEDIEYTVWGAPVRDLELDLQPGWNMIGTVWDPVNFSDPDDDPDGAILGSPEHSYRYNPITLEYTRSNTLTGGYSYFVLATEETHLSLPGSGAGKLGITDQPAVFTVMGQELTVGRSANEKIVPVLPALPGQSGTTPAWIDADGIRAISHMDETGIFDVQVSSTGPVTFEAVDVPQGQILTVNGAELPATFSKGGDFEVRIDTRTINSIDITGAYPNPFNAYTAINFTAEGNYSLQIISTDGRLIRTLSEGTGNGRSSLIWDGTADDGSHAASGQYLIRLATDRDQVTTPILLVK